MVQLRRSLSILAVLFAAVVPAKGQFVAASDEKVVFRRDRIPLEVGQIRRLSNDIMIMAETIRGAEASERRLAAQCLGLSLALEPGNRDARLLLREWKLGEARPVGDAKHASRALDHSFNLLNWLESDEAGEDARKLAAFLKDIISRIGIGDPRYEMLRDGAELGDWAGWVPDLAAYTKPDSQWKPPSGSDGPKPEKAFEFAVERAEIVIPMWVRAEKPENGRIWVLQPGSVSMVASYDEQRKAEPFLLQLGSDGFNEQMQQFALNMTRLLERELGPLPGGLRVGISSSMLEQSLRSGQPQSVSAVIVALAGAAVRGLAPDPETIVIGKVADDGRFLSSSDTWGKLRALGKGQGQRLVVPEQDRHYLMAMLTMGNLAFFFDYEVVTASNLGELLNATVPKPKGGLGAACEKFAEIQEVSKGKQMRTFVANSHVRKRLQDVVQASPDHLSGEFLLMQSNSSRPFNVSRQVLFSEMLTILEPFELVRSIPWDAANERSFRRLPIEIMTEECKGKIEALEKYVGREERDLYQDVESVFDAMRDYGRALNNRGDYDSVTGLLMRASGNAERAYRNYAKALKDAMGE